MTTTFPQVRHADARLLLQLVSVRGVAIDGLLPLPPEGRGMAQALALGETQIGAARWQAADRCRIAWRGDNWLLSNHSRHLVCALNGIRIATGEQAILQVGDILELDLLRFQLIEHQPACRRPDPFEALHIEAVARPVSSHSAQRSGRGAGEQYEQLLALLNDEFVAVVRDPMQLAGHANWQQTMAPAGESAPTLEELSAQAEPYLLMRDILLSRVAIDSVIGSFDGFGAPDLAHREMQPDVLRLFAPDVVRRSGSQLPALTRREHHSLSIDSAMAIGHVRPGDDRRET
ncbi:TagK domain-containing protein [Variovorax sp. RHLX14]|uniref:TagK domain-containing protein n=1 Tax=Variovorax sp. RHLX14 TaxID=1259731 RepID=UPI003F48FEED